MVYAETGKRGGAGFAPPLFIMVILFNSVKIMISRVMRVRPDLTG